MSLARRVKSGPSHRFPAGSIRRLVAALALVLCVAGCGESPGSPVYAAADGYLNSLANGSFSGACALLDGPTRTALVKSTGSRVSCERAFTLCLPDRALVPKQDQSQLLYADVALTVNGAKASAKVSGTPVANALKRFTLAQEGRRWKLTSPGTGLKGCQQRARHRRRASHSSSRG